jgi:hypothetical protein
MSHLLFKGVGFEWFYICALNFVFLIDTFWRNMFLKLNGAHTCFNHAYMQCEMTFLL